MPGRAGQWMGWISYTLSRSLRTYNPNVYGTGYYPYVLDQPHVLTALGSYAITDAWRVGARVRFVSGNPITPVTGSYFDAGSQRYEPESGDVLSTRLPAFFQLDLRVDRTWKRSWGILRLFLDIQNVTNRANPEDIIYNNDYSDFVYARGLPILPVLGLEYRQWAVPPPRPRSARALARCVSLCHARCSRSPSPPQAATRSPSRRSRWSRNRASWRSRSTRPWCPSISATPRPATPRSP